MLANQEAIDKQTSETSVKNNKEALFTDKNKHRFGRCSSGGCQKVKRLGYQQECSLQTGGVQRNRGNSGQYKLKKVRRELLQLRKESYIAKDYWSKKKVEVE